MTRRDEPIPALSAGLSHVVLTGLFLAVAFVPRSSAPPPSAGAGFAMAPQVLSRLPDASKPASPQSSSAAPPAGVTETAVVDEWPAEDIIRGKEQCMHLLSGTAAEIEWLEPVKSGACGLPAPVRLKSLGSEESKVVFDPPVNVNCRLVAALGTWLKTSVQPKAEERFKSRVVKIVRASGYSCRNIYNRPNARLSQHALANAIDIAGFALASGQTVGVLNGWGLTERDIKARAKAKAEAAAKAKKEGKDAKSKGEAAEAGADAKAVETEAGAPPGKGKTALLDQGAKNLTRASLTPSALTKKAIPGAGANAKADPAKPTRESLFLRDIHGGACRYFGTVLGPEANDPHRNHFHLDLIPRQSHGYCE